MELIVSMSNLMLETLHEYITSPPLPHVENNKPTTTASSLSLHT